MRLGNKGKPTVNSASNRAEDVRSRRTQRSQQRVTEAKQRATNPVHVRPVVVRGNAFGTPIHRQTSRTAPRRAYYVTVDQAAGTELRLPSLPMLRPGWRLLSALITMAAMFGIYTMTNSEAFRLNSVEVIGLQRITQEEITNTIDLGDVSIIEVNAREIQEKLTSAYPELIDVAVSVSLPNFVSVTTSERQPVMIWQKGDQVQWIDAEGVVFTPRGDAGPLVRIHSDDDLPMNVVLVDPDAEEAAAAQESSAAEETAANPIPVTGARTVQA